MNLSNGRSPTSDVARTEPDFGVRAANINDEESLRVGA